MFLNIVARMCKPLCLATKASLRTFKDNLHVVFIKDDF